MLAEDQRSRFDEEQNFRSLHIGQSRLFRPEFVTTALLKFPTYLSTEVPYSGVALV